MLPMRKGRRQKRMCTLQPNMVSNRGKWKPHEVSQTLCVWTLFVCTLQNDECAMGRKRVAQHHHHHQNHRRYSRHHQHHHHYHHKRHHPLRSFALSTSAELDLDFTHSRYLLARLGAACVSVHCVRNCSESVSIVYIWKCLKKHIQPTIEHLVRKTILRPCKLALNLPTQSSLGTLGLCGGFQGQSPKNSLHSWW
jgi:hypothetical protein